VHPLLADRRRLATLAGGVILFGVCVALSPRLVHFPGLVDQATAPRAARVLFVVLTLAGAAFYMRYVRAAKANALPRGTVIAWAWVLVASWCASIAPPSFGMAAALVPYLATFAFVAVVEQLRVDLREAVVVGAVGIAASVILDAEGVLQGGSRRPGGFLDNRNFAAELLAIAMPISIASLARNKRLWVFLALLGLALAWTRTRGAWIACAAGTGVLVAFSAPAERRTRAIGAGVLLAGALAAGIVPAKLAWTEANPYLSSLQHSVDVEGGSGRVRLAQHPMTFRALSQEDAWLKGFGPGNWQRAVHADDASAPMAAQNRIPHSDYLRTLADAGIFALAGLVALYATWLLGAWRKRREAPDRLAMAVSLIIMSAVDAPFFRLESIAVACFVLPLATSTPSESPSSKSPG
jgi:O-antigen ligase